VRDGQAADNHAKQAGEDAQQQGLSLSGHLDALFRVLFQGINNGTQARG